MIRWHRAGWKLLWRLKSRPGRPSIPVEVQALIRRMANEDPSWGEERIANELFLKLGIRVSPRTVNKYLPIRPTRRPRSDMRWSTFLRLHAQGGRPACRCRQTPAVLSMRQETMQGHGAPRDETRRLDACDTGNVNSAMHQRTRISWSAKLRTPQFGA
jgi:hypothetical protein